MNEMSPLELDALIEIFNISVGRAAACLSDLTHESVSMSVPIVHFISAKRAALFLDPDNNRNLTCVSQEFDGGFSGKAMLMFPSADSLEIVRRMLGADVPIEQLSELEQDAMSEIGNIILNSCFATIADMLNNRFRCELPVLSVGYISQILGDSCAEKQVLFLQIRLGLDEHDLEGFLVFLLGDESRHGLHQSIVKFLSGAV